MNIQTLITLIGTEVNSLIGIMIALAVAVFIWGLVAFLFKAGDETSHKEGKNRMIWGIIALFVMVSVWGIVNFVASDLGVTPASVPGGTGGNPACLGQSDTGMLNCK